MHQGVAHRAVTQLSRYITVARPSNQCIHTNKQMDTTNTPYSPLCAVTSTLAVGLDTQTAFASGELPSVQKKGPDSRFTCTSLGHEKTAPQIFPRFQGCPVLRTSAHSCCPVVVVPRQDAGAVAGLPGHATGQGVQAACLGNTDDMGMTWKWGQLKREKQPSGECVLLEHLEGRKVSLLQHDVEACTIVTPCSYQPQ